MRFNTFHDTAINNTISRADETPIWTNGGTIAVSTPWLPNTSFLFTGLYGEDNLEIDTISFIDPDNAIASRLKSDVRTELLDFELLARTPIPDTNANWIIGLEYIRFDVESKITSGIPLLVGRKERNNLKIFVAKLGIGGFYDLSEDGRHRMFSNILLGGGFTRNDSSVGTESWTTFAGDVNVGYEWVIDKVFSISPRYRAQFVYQTDIDDNVGFNDQFFVLHGPELHFSARF